MKPQDDPRFLPFVGCLVVLLALGLLWLLGLALVGCHVLRDGIGLLWHAATDWI